MASSAPKKQYITKRILKSATSKAFKDASNEALEISESVVEVSDGWVIRRYRNGEFEKLRKLPKVNPEQIALD